MLTILIFMLKRITKISSSTFLPVTPAVVLMCKCFSEICLLTRCLSSCSAYISHRLPEEPCGGPWCLRQQCTGWRERGSGDGPWRRRRGPGWVGFPLSSLPYSPALALASAAPSSLSRPGARSPRARRPRQNIRYVPETSLQGSLTLLHHRARSKGEGSCEPSPQTEGPYGKRFQRKQGWSLSGPDPSSHGGPASSGQTQTRNGLAHGLPVSHPGFQRLHPTLQSWAEDGRQLRLVLELCSRLSRQQARLLHLPRGSVRHPGTAKSEPKSPAFHPQ